MAANAREVRRKKILERRSDRLALITGQIQNIPTPPSASSHSQPSDACTDSSHFPLIINDQAIPPVISHPNSSVSPQDEAEESGPILSKPDPVIDPDNSDACKSSSKTPPLRELEHSQISNVPTSEVDQLQPPPGSSVVPSDVDQVQPPLDPSGFILGSGRQSSVQSWDPKLFTPGEISSAVNASKITRLCCSIVVALLVVFSYVGFPLLDNKYVKNILSFRPLYLVLVTNVTVVIAQLFTGKRRGSGRQNRTSSDSDDWTEHLGRALEAALVMRNVMDAVFMDCASYAITVICGLSLVQLFSQ